MLQWMCNRLTGHFLDFYAGYWKCCLCGKVLELRR